MGAASRHGSSGGDFRDLWWKTRPFGFMPSPTTQSSARPGGRSVGISRPQMAAARARRDMGVRRGAVAHMGHQAMTFAISEAKRAPLASCLPRSDEREPRWRPLRLQSGQQKNWNQLFYFAIQICMRYLNDINFNMYYTANICWWNTTKSLSLKLYYTEEQFGQLNLVEELIVFVPNLIS